MKRTTPSSAGSTNSSGGSAESSESSTNGDPQETSPLPKPPEVPPILLEGDEPASKPASQGPDTRFSAPAAPPKTVDQPSDSALPLSYGTGLLLLTARDPHCLYAHWDRPPETPSHWPEAALTLRVHQETLGGPVAAEHSIPADARHAFVPVDSPANRYVAELGYYPSAGDWRPLAASDPAVALSTPTPSAEKERFATMPFPLVSPTNLQTGEPVRLPEPKESGAGSLGLHVPQVTGQPSKVQPAGPTLQLEFPLVRTSIGMETPLVPGAEPVLESEPEVQEQDLEPAPAAFRSSWTEASNGPWGAGQQRVLAELIGWSLIKYRGLSSIDLDALTRGQLGLPSEFAAAALSSLAAAEKSNEGLASAPLGEQPGFWLNVNAELVIYGATEPGAKVAIGGRPIELRADGSFSYRFSLPDGEYRLPIAAISRTGEQRGATLEFFRKTSTSGTVGVHPQDPGLVPPE
jgi:uncharacterized protein